MADINERIIVLANRAPMKHEYAGGGIVATRSASGLVTALEPLLQAYAGTWVAHAAGSADAHVVDTHGGFDVPSATPRYRVRFVTLPDDEFRGYYYGFANEGLWPLCHDVDVPPVFRRADYEMYRAANTRFANVVADEARGATPIVLVQDYHFALAPRIVRQRHPGARLVAFWHIPWPRPRTFSACPWAVELLDGLLGSDIVGLQTEEDRHNFLGCVEAVLPAKVDAHDGTIRYRGHETTVRVYPVGVDCDHDALRTAPPAAECRAWARQTLGLPADVRIGVGVDRMDYTKGITEKFLAIESLLDTQPSLVGKLVFAQIAEPSRDCLSAYRAARQQAFDTAQRINRRFRSAIGAPIRLLERHHEPADVYRYYRAADFCYVGSRHDGMNLVAKEFVASRSDEQGVLILSEFAGAARQLRAALQIDPLRPHQGATAIAQALRMPAIEQAKRMRVMRSHVLSFDASWWARQLVHDALNAAATAPVAAESRWSEAVA